MLAQEPSQFGLVDSWANISEATTLGVSWSRVTIRWDEVQPTNANDWETTALRDAEINAELSAGRQVMVVVVGTPGWAASDGTTNRTAVPALTAWQRFLSRLVNNYQGRVNHWIIWDQPDVTDPTVARYAWSGNEEQYYQLLRASYVEIKQIDPQMQVYVGGLTYTWDNLLGRPQYLFRLLNIINLDPQAEANSHFFDGVVYHHYNDPPQLLDLLTDVQGILNSYGLSDKTINLLELNAPLSDDFGQPLTPFGTLTVTAAEQGHYIIQATALALAGGADRVAINRLLSTGAPDPLGLLRADGSRRPAFFAYELVVRHFANTQDADWQQLDDIYLVTLKRGAQMTRILWNTSQTAQSFAVTTNNEQAILVDERGFEQPLFAQDGQFIIELPAAICANGPDDCPIGGAPRLLVEANFTAENQTAEATVVTSAQVLTPVVITPTVSIPASPTSAIATGEVVAVAPTATSASVGFTATATQAPEAVAVAPTSVPDAVATPLADLPPPVNIYTVLTPERLLWMFVIGVVVFTVSYILQVLVWYRVRR